MRSSEAGELWRSLVWQDPARQAGPGVVSRDEAVCGVAGQACRGVVGVAESDEAGFSRPGLVKQAKARFGLAGEVKQGESRRGEAKQAQ